MKKRSITVALTALAALTTLSGCNSGVEKKDGYLLTMTGKNDETVSLSAEDFFNDYLKSRTGIKDYYDALYEVVVRELFEVKLVTKRAELYEKAKDKVASAKEDAKNNASKESSYDKEFKKILDDNKVKDEKELLEKFAYDLMKVEVKDQFYESGATSWAPEAWNELVVGERDESGNLILKDGKPVYEGYLESMIPYHIKHILVKVNAGHNTFYNGAISKENAKKLGGVVKSLATRAEYDTFGKIAKSYSEDEGSGKNFGELDPMTRTTSFVPEFKLGVYAYEGLFSSKATDEEKAKLRIPEAASTKLTDEFGLGEIPYEAALKLIEVAEYETDAKGNKVKDGEAIFYPRNIYFNKYFNKHNISVITPNSTNAADEVGTPNPTYEALSGFQAVPELGDKKVLTDEKGNVVLVARAGSSGSYEGVHFIVIERSALINEVDGVTLKDYYTIETPDSDKYPRNDEGEVLDTYVNAIATDAKGYKERATKIKNGIKNFDSRIDDRIFMKMMELLNVQIHDEELKEKLEAYLTNEKENALYDANQKMLEEWDNFLIFLDAQEENRIEERLVNEACAIAFREAGTAPEYAEGGICDKYV